MSSDPLPEVEITHDHLIPVNGFSDVTEISSVKHDVISTSDENSSQNGPPIVLNETPATNSITLENDTLSVEVSYPPSEALVKDVAPVSPAHLSPDLQKAQTSPRTSSLYHQRKEAIRGFVLSKLTKKPTAADSSSGNPPDIERRTLFSGFKEKLAKKLEDSTSKEVVVPHPPVITISDRSTLPSEFHAEPKSECELKSVVANEVGSDSVEEGEECFEEIKRTLKEETYSIDSDRFSFTDRLDPPVLGTPRSQTTSNLNESTKMVQSLEPSSDKPLSFSFSDLQKADALDHNDDIQVEASSTSVPEIHFEPAHDPVPASISTDTVNDEAPVDSTPSKKNVCIEFLSKHLPQLLFKSVCSLIIVFAVCVYWLLQYNYPFLAGLVFGLTIVILIYMLISDFIGFSETIVHFPDYKTLPPLVTPSSTSLETEIYVGWMNQLLGDYNPESFKVSNVSSVYVHLEGRWLRLSYPKKQVPKRMMWNEVLPANNCFIKESKYRLFEAKITLPPDDLPRKRIWAKRFPICIILPNFPSRQRSPSVDCSSLVEDKPPSPVKTPSGQSLPTSLSGSPVHSDTDQTVLYLFARSDREKEEWYWRLYRAMHCPLDSCQSADAFFHETVDALVLHSEKSAAVELGKSDVLLAKEEKPRASPQKQFLFFDEYMQLLMKQLSNDDDSTTSKTADQEMPSLQWLNVLIGRLFYDFLTQKKWSDLMQARIQQKLRRLKVPSYMHELVCTDVFLGTSLPQIRRTSKPVMDERGLWLDLDIDYTGSFRMTLETKIKLQLLEKRDPAEDEVSRESVVAATPVISGEVIRMSEEYSELTDDDEDLPDSEASKEETIVCQPAHTSTGTKLRQTVERWVTSSTFTENKFVKKCVGHITQTPIVLTVEVKALCGTLVINIPPLPTDRLWYGFRKKPQVNIHVCPKVGERHFNYTAVQKYIEKKLHQELEKALVMPNMDDISIPLMHSTVYDQ